MYKGFLRVSATALPTGSTLDYFGGVVPAAPDVVPVNAVLARTGGEHDSDADGHGHAGSPWPTRHSPPSR